MGFLATLLRHQHPADGDSIAAVEKPEKKRGFWRRKKAPQKAPKLSLFLAQDEGVSVRTGSLTASLASGSRASLSTKSSSGRSRMSVSFNPLELECVPERPEYSNEIQQEDDNHKDLIRHPSKTLKTSSKNAPAENEQNVRNIRPLTPHPATSSWKLSRNSKKERKKHRKEKKSKKRKNQQVKLSNEKLSSLDGPILSTRLEEKQPVLRKRSSSTSSLDSEESAKGLKIKSIPLKSYRSKDRLARNDDEGHTTLVAQETDEDSIQGKGIPLTIFRRKNRQNEAPIDHIVEEKIENDLSVTSDPNESLASFSVLSSISSVSSTAKKLMDDDSLVRKSMVNDYSVPYQVSTERSSPIRKGVDTVPPTSTPSSPTSTTVPNIEDDDDNFSDDLLQSMLDEVSKDMEELQSLFERNKTISSLDTGTVDQNENPSSVANFANEQSSQCSTASFDLDEFAEDEFDDPIPFNRGGKFTISTIVEEDEDGSEDDPIEAALKRGRQYSLRAEIESSRSVESDLTSASASKVSLTGSLISFVTEDREEEHRANDNSTSASDPSTPSRGLNKSISWKMGKPEVHVFHPYTDKSYNIDSALNMVSSFDPRCDKRKREPEGAKASCKRPVSILRSNSGREIYLNSQEKENRSVPPVTKQKAVKSSDVSLSGSVTSSTSIFSEASESVCRMLDRLRDETERRRARIRQRREFKQ
jgi:hypothetical protein